MHHPKQHVRLRECRRRRRRPAYQLMSDIIREIFDNNSACISIAVGGPGGTGKSTFAKQLAEALGDAAVFPLDEYKTSRSVRHLAGVFGPHPDANKMAEIARHLGLIKDGLSFQMPVYDRELGDAVDTREYRPRRYNLIDGEVASYREFHDLVDFSIFIDSDWRTQLATRLSRDLQDRDYSPEKAVATFLYSNLREFSEHGAESKVWADVHLFCHDDYRFEIESISRSVYERVENCLHDTVETVGLSGLIVPLLTPFAADGAIARKAFVEHLAWLANAGVRRVLVGGTTGEFFSLSADERLELLKLALEYFSGLSMFHVGGGALCDTLRFAEQAGELGADAIFCLPPCYYANAPAAGVISYLREVAAASDLPLILYNFPLHTQNPLIPEILSAVPHFGMKDSSGDLSLLDASPRYFIGDNGAKIMKALELGGTGFVSSAANVEPDPYLEFERLFFAGKLEDARDLSIKLGEIAESLASSEILTMKKMLSRIIVDYSSAVRPPLGN